MEAGMSRLRLEEPAPARRARPGACALAVNEEDYQCEYREDIWQYLLETEKPKMRLQSPQLQFRGALVKQLREAMGRLRLNTATLHAAVQLLDLFMDAHDVGTDRLTDLAFACLSLAAKSEEKFSRAPCLKTLSKMCGVHLSPDTFRQLEWMVGQHVRWRLLLPTAVTFATLLAHYIVTERDLISKNPQFVQKFKKEGFKQLDSYLDLTLYNVRLKMQGTAEVGCACVACARAHLGLEAWPRWLAGAAGRSAEQVAPIATTLQRMMELLKSREASLKTEPDQGYGSARTSPSLTPCASPRIADSPASSSGSNSAHRHHGHLESCSHHKPVVETTVILREDIPMYIRDQTHLVNTAPSSSNTLGKYSNKTLDYCRYQPKTQIYGNLVPDVNHSTQLYANTVPEVSGSLRLSLGVDNYRFSRSQRLVEASMEILEPRGLKRAAAGVSLELDRKRNRV